MAETTSFKYRAFLSYSHRDKAWGQWLHAALEGYSIYKDLIGREAPLGPIPKTLRPIFRDREDFAAGASLTNQTLAALEASQFVIVICSPNAAQSKYVNEEIRRFKALGRGHHIIPVIVDGEPNDPERECFPPALCFEVGPDGALTDEREEPIAADARPEHDGKDLAQLKAVAGLLGLGLDEIVHRAERARRKRVRNWGAALLLLTATFAGLAVWAEINRREAETQRNYAEQETIAALRNEAISLAALSTVALNRGQPVEAAQLALAAWPREGDDKRPQMRRVITALSSALPQLHERGYFKGHDHEVASATFSPDGTRIVTASYDKTARVWDATTGAVLIELKHRDYVKSAAFSPDGQRIVTASDDKTARIWEATADAVFTELKGDGDYVYSAAFSPDGGRIVTTSRDKTARVWDATTRAILTELKGHGDGVTSAAFSPDGGRIVTASDDSTARVWDAMTGVVLQKLKGHDGAVTSAAFSPDGQRVVTASADKTARIWNTTTGALLTELKGHGDWVESAAFSPDGGRIVTASDDSTARVWDISTLEDGDAFAVACARLGNNADLTDLAKRYGLADLKPICGANTPNLVDWSKVQE